MNKLVKELTLKEKATLVVGKNVWETVNIDRLNIPSIMMTDGPHGVRKERTDTESDGFNKFKSFNATCFPTASCLASSFNPQLIYTMGKEIGKQASALGVNILLGPGINHKRTPIGGRNFEYFSEDPFLTGKLATKYIIGVQENGVGCSLKHFMANNTEYLRQKINIKIDERTLREIYLRAFEIVVKNAKPYTVMSAYNKVDGEFCSENKRLLTTILRNEWGFDGIVISDWWALHDRVKGIIAGCNLEMPFYQQSSIDNVMASIKNGELKEELLDGLVSGILDLVEKCVKKTNVNLNLDYGHEISLSLAEDSIVLLKNDNVLPLKSDFCMIGDLAKNPRYQGAGSSKVIPFKIDNCLDCINEKLGKIDYALGYVNDDNFGDEDKILIDEAMSLAKSHNTVVIIVGLNDKSESENEDRKNIDLPLKQNLLVDRACECFKNVIVVVQTGSPVSMPWADKVKAIIQAGLNGEAGGKALAKTLLGEISPSGRLSETYPIALNDVLANKYYAYSESEMEYKEGIFSGYRYFDSYNVPVLFPFGYGLSYSQFEYANLNVSYQKNNTIVEVDIKNIGCYDASEVILLFVEKVNSGILRAKKELKAFDKVYLKKNESKKMTLHLDDSSFNYFDVELNSWQIEKGLYKIEICKNVNEIIMFKSINIA